MKTQHSIFWGFNFYFWCDFIFPKLKCMFDAWSFPLYSISTSFPKLKSPTTPLDWIAIQNAVRKSLNFEVLKMKIKIEIIRLNWCWTTPNNTNIIPFGEKKNLLHAVPMGSSTHLDGPNGGTHCISLSSSRWQAQIHWTVEHWRTSSSLWVPIILQSKYDLFSFCAIQRVPNFLNWTNPFGS